MFLLHFRPSLQCVPLGLCVWILLRLGFSSSLADDVSFNRDIRPILSEYCFACHGPDKNSRQADLRLDDRDHAIQMGVIQPGHAESSTLIERILSTDPDVMMPPPKSGKKVSEEHRALLQRWIQSGAEYQPHWAFIPPAAVVPVPPSKSHAEWIRNEIDAFVVSQLETRGMVPAPESTRERWLRRVTFDLTGLPPSLSEIDAFVADSSDRAYETVVDRLLASEAYGERMASMWLDVARYADTFGYQSDVNMEVWPWRDWVIRAFNDNLPFDQFVTWQMAGDLIPNATRDQKLATTFHRLHRQTNEGGSIEEEFRQVYIADRTATTATTFLGLTMECCRCHDHKYDPISQKDFYRFAAYFANIDEHGLYSHFTSTAPTPTLLLYEGNQQLEHERAWQQIASMQSQVDAVRQGIHKRFDARENKETDRSMVAVPEPDLNFPLDAGAPGVVDTAMAFNGDDSFGCAGALQYGRHTPVSLSFWIKPTERLPRIIVLHQSVAAEDSAFRGLQLVLADGKPQFSLIHFWPGNAIRVQAADPIDSDVWTHIGVTYDGSSQANGVRLFVNGLAIETTTIRDQLTRDILHRAEWGDSSAGSVGLALGARFRDVGFRGGSLDALHLYHRELSSLEIASIFQAENPHKSRIAITDAMVLDHMVKQDPAWLGAHADLLTAKRAENELVTNVRQIMTMATAKQPREMRILIRGAYDAPGERVSPGTPSPIQNRFPDESADRLSLAKWMTDPNHPLMSRVAVNRMWHLFFGRGIVASLEDFGSQGSPPSHPELLDWMARAFVNDGWNVKRWCKRVVLSNTYRQSSIPRDPSWLTSDPDNKYLARGPRHRLSAEQVRDGVLEASGLLARKLGGPSVMPYQPAGLWEEAGTGKSYTQAHDEGLYRRSLYTFWRRTAPPPSMLTFDATSRETCTAKRELTATPLQSLVLLNDPQYVEAARYLAQQLVSSYADDPASRIVEAFRRLTSRPPSEAELTILKQLYDEQRATFEQHPDTAKELLSVGEKPLPSKLDWNDVGAMTIVVSTIMNFDETMTKR